MSCAGIRIGSAVLKALATYRCDECGATATGETMRIDLSRMNHPMEQLIEIARAEFGVKLAHAIPVGWATYGANVQKCPKCVNNQRKP